MISFGMLQFPAAVSSWQKKDKWRRDTTNRNVYSTSIPDAIVLAT